MDSFIGSQPLLDRVALLRATPLLSRVDEVRAEHERIAELSSLRARARGLWRLGSACFFTAALAIFSWSEVRKRQGCKHCTQYQLC